MLAPFSPRRSPSSTTCTACCVSTWISGNAERVRDEIGAVTVVAESCGHLLGCSSQEASASTREIADSAQQLAETAAELEDLARRFKVA